MPRESAVTKARRYLTEGRVIVTEVAGGRASASVRGDGAMHRVEVRGPAWSCTCPARGRCCHALALGLVIAFDHAEVHP